MRRKCYQKNIFLGSKKGIGTQQRTQPSIRNIESATISLFFFSSRCVRHEIHNRANWRLQTFWIVKSLIILFLTWPLTCYIPYLFFLSFLTTLANSTEKFFEPFNGIFGIPLEIVVVVNKIQTEPSRISMLPLKIIK